MEASTDDQGPPVDLTSCDREPIHILGAVQPFGFLLGVSSDWIVVRASANAPEPSLLVRAGVPAAAPRFSRASASFVESAWMSARRLKPPVRAARTPPPMPNSALTETPEGLWLVVSFSTDRVGAGDPAPLKVRAPVAASRENWP